MSGRGLLALAAVLAVVVYAGTFSADFTLDDGEIVRDNPVVHAGDAATILTTDYWAGSEYADHTLYRPVTIATYALQHALHGATPAPYHMVNVLLHALVTLLLGWLVRDLFGSDIAAVVAAALFAVHPVHVEAVAGVVGRAEILALGGTLLATLAWFRAGTPAGPTKGQRTGKTGPTTLWSLAAVAAYALGAGAKETGVLAPAVILATEAVLPARRRLLPAGRPRDKRAVLTFVGFLAVLGGYVALRAGAVSGRSINAAMASLSAGDRMLVSLRILAENVGLLFVPTPLSADYPASSVGVGSVADAGVLAGMALIGLGAWILWRSRRTFPAAAWGVLFFALMYFPVSNFAFAIGIPRAERLLYAPSAGFVVVVAGLLAPWLTTPADRTRVLVATAAASVVFGFMTWRAAGAWQNDCTLAEATLRVEPESAQFLTRRAACRLDQGDIDGARRDLAEALRVRPGYPTALLYQGVLEREQGNLDAALELLTQLLAREPRHAAALDHVSWIYYRQQRWSEAVQAAESLRTVRPDDPAPVALLIGAYAASGDLERAESIAAFGRRRFPQNESVRHNAEILSGLLGGR